MIIRAILLLPLLLIVTPAGARAATEPLARPTALEPAVTFWRRVYTEVTTSEGFVHDDLKLDIVYETVRLSNANDRGRSSSASEAAGRYVRALRAIAAGKREKLSAAEQRVMELWGPNIDRSAVSAAAERVRFQLGQANRFREGLIRAGAWEDFVKKTIAEANLPREIASLPHVESSFNPAARSKVGAAGMWQFMGSTGRRFMRIDNVVDERLDPYISTRAAALLMRQNYEVTGAWPLAITAYNHGASGMRRAKAQVGSDDIALIVRKYKSRTFGFASRNFYAALLAAVDVDDDPARYFGPLDRNARDNSRVLVLPDYIAVGTLAKSLGVDADVLEEFNLSLKPVVWNGTKRVPKGYELRVPHSAGDPQQLLASLPSDAWNSKQTEDLFHVVQQGETLSGIAPRYGARVSDLIAINSLTRAARIRPGQKLILPAGISKNATDPVVDQGIYPEPVAPTSKPVVVATRKARTDVPNVAVARADTPRVEVPQVIVPAAAIVVPVIVADAPEAVAAQSPATQSPRPVEAMESQQRLLADPSDYSVADDRTIRVQEDETIGHYADWLGVRASDLRRLNGMRSASAMQVGRRLKLDFSKSTPEQFETARVDYHQGVQELFFAKHRIVATSEHVVRPGESIWVLAERRYNVPVWLLRQYNPDLDLALVRPSTRVVIPVLASPGA